MMVVCSTGAYPTSRYHCPSFGCDCKIAYVTLRYCCVWSYRGVHNGRLWDVSGT